METDSRFAKITELYSQTLDEWKPVFEARWKAYKYAAGDQWEQAITQKLDKENRPHLTINLIFPQVLTAFGSQNLNKTGVTTYPLKGTTKEKAEAMKKLLKNYENLNQSDRAIGVAQADAIIGGFGSVSVTFNDEKDVEGSVRIKDDDPFITLLDPNTTQADLSDCRYAFRHHWMSADELQEMFPTKKVREALGKFNARKESWWEKGVKIVKGVFTKLTGDKQLSIFDLYDQSQDLYKVLYFYEKERVSHKYIHDGSTGGTFEAPKNKKDLDTLLRYNPQLRLVTKKKDVIMLTIVCPVLGVTLADKHKYKIQSKRGNYPFICFWGYDFLHTKTETFGVAKNLISLQDDYNKRESQILHIINSTANGGWMVEKGSVDTDWLREHGAQTGVVIEYRGGRAPQKIQPDQYPSSLMNTADKRPEQIQLVSGINPNMAGFSQTAEETGTLFRQRLEAGRGLLQPLFDNNHASLIRLWTYVVDVAAQCESTEKIFQIVHDNGQVETAGINVMMPDGSIINDIRQANIGIHIDAGDNTPTARLARFMSKLELSKHMPPELVNWAWVLKDSDLPDVDEQIEYIQRVMGMQSAQQEEEMSKQNINELLQMRGLINDQQQSAAMTAKALQETNQGKQKG